MSASSVPTSVKNVRRHRGLPNRTVASVAATHAAPVTATKHEWTEYHPSVTRIGGPVCAASTSDEPIAAASAPAGDSTKRHSTYESSSAAPIVPIVNGFITCHGVMSSRLAVRPASQNHAGG